jgi:hypothetical protein
MYEAKRAYHHPTSRSGFHSLRIRGNPGHGA